MKDKKTLKWHGQSTSPFDGNCADCCGSFPSKRGGAAGRQGGEAQGGDAGAGCAPLSGPLARAHASPFLVATRSRQREARLAEQAAQGAELGKAGKVGQGLRSAGENIGAGLAGGLGGLFTAPVKGAQKEGVGGFFKGVGKGLAGAVLKPVVGLSEGVTAVVASVSHASATDW